MGIFKKKSEQKTDKAVEDKKVVAPQPAPTAPQAQVKVKRKVNDILSSF